MLQGGQPAEKQLLLTTGKGSGDSDNRASPDADVDGDVASDDAVSSCKTVSLLTRRACVFFHSLLLSRNLSITNII